MGTCSRISYGNLSALILPQLVRDFYGTARLKSHLQTRAIEIPPTTPRRREFIRASLMEFIRASLMELIRASLMELIRASLTGTCPPFLTGIYSRFLLTQGFNIYLILFNTAI